MKPYPVENSYKSQALVGLLISIWLVLFLVFIAPFDASDLSFNLRLLLLPPYGLIFFICYLVMIFLQNWIYKSIQKWNLLLELLIIGLVYLSVLYGTFLYYQSDIINGDWPFQIFVSYIYIPTWIILGFPIFFGRWFIARKKKTEVKRLDESIPIAPTKLTLRGDNKLDVLQIEFQNLVCISSAQNYVEIFYLQNKSLQKKLLRTTLKKISQDAPAMIRVHRSHLINPSHFIQWNDSTSILVSELEIPVSKNHKETLNAIVK